jgi:hypothetical protein
MAIKADLRNFRSDAAHLAASKDQSAEIARLRLELSSAQKEINELRAKILSIQKISYL